MGGYLTHYVGRPSPLYFAERLTEHCRTLKTASGLSGGAKIYLKREELNHTGAHKVNNVLGQILLARRMGKKRIIAETGAGMHGVATATLCARFGLECIVYMGAVDVERQKANVFRMNMLGAKVVPVESGSKTLKDAMNEALRDWVTNVGNTFYCIGTIAGPHPYPMMVRDFSRSLAARRASRCRKPKAVCRIHWSPASAAARTPWVFFMRSSTTGRSKFTASKQRVMASTPGCMPPRSPAGGLACCMATAPIC